MVAVSSADVFGLITVIRVIAPPRRVSAASSPLIPGAADRDSCGRRRRRAQRRTASPLRRYSAANAPQNASPAPVLSTGSTTSVGTADGFGIVAGRDEAAGFGEFDDDGVRAVFEESLCGVAWVGGAGQFGRFDLAGQEHITRRGPRRAAAASLPVM